MIRKSVLLLGLVSMMLIANGCIFSPPDDPSPIPVVTGLPFPDTPAQLMQNFKRSYEDMSIDEYRDLLHPDYLTILKPSTTQEFPEVGETLDYTDEMRIQTNMFSGAPGHDPKGNLTNPISSISFQDPAQLTAWELSPQDDPIPNALSALYSVFFEFHRAGDKTLQVTGEIKFYITSRDSLYQGSVKPYYQMIGQWDLTNDGP